jgi:hypothetical protein
MNVQPIVNAAVAEAKNLPDLVNKLNAADPALAQQLTGKSLLASKTPYGVMVSGLVAYLVGRWALGWDQQMDELVSGIIVLAGSAVGSIIMRLVTKAPITSLTGWAAMLLMGLSLTACADLQAKVQAFCVTDQPVLGTLAVVAADGAAVALPQAAPAAPIVGTVVADVNGFCKGLPPAAPAPGVTVVVPTAK